MTKTKRFAAATVAAGIAAITLGLAAPAGAYTVSGTLEGDPRAGNGPNPAGIIINVTVEVGDTASGCGGLGNRCSFWTIDLDMDGAHADAKLDQFYFNLGQVGEDSKFTGAVFANFNPMGWSVSTPADEQGGGDFTPSFLFEADGGAEVNNDTDLTFNMTLSAGNSFDIAGAANDFIGENLRLSTTTAFAGEWQLGAHVQSLGDNGQASGFAVGGFEGDNPPPPPGVAEPGTIALFSLGLVGLGMARRRRQV